MNFLLSVLAFFYQGLKRFLFLFDPEFIHEKMVAFGEFLGSVPLIVRCSSLFFGRKYSQLSQTIAGIRFDSPIGLAAGFDYEARLTQILPSIGFGFQTVGTISNEPCAGNAKPRLGRLPKSRSLLVNKGFKNPGSIKIIHKLEHLEFPGVVGISVGLTNHKTFHSLQAVIEDILHCFLRFEKSHVHHAYYELNISCPNLATHFNFYAPKKLDALLTQVDALQLKKPVFVKMPISESNETTLSLLSVIVKHSPVGVIIGNLQKDRMNKAVVPAERENLGPGNLSGKPTFERSNELIALAYKKYHKKLTIIGCGGVFSAEDAFLKITLGASLIQMITGMIFEGPQVVAQINLGLSELLEKHQFSHIQDAIGSKNR